LSGAPIKSSASLEALLEENRRFPPPSGFQKHANQRDPGIYERASGDVEGFWAEQAESLDWIKKWDRVLEWKLPWAKWFLGGKLNVSASCLDRHVKTWRRNKAAFYWEPETGHGKVLTYSDLYREVNKFANTLKSLGVRKGDRVTIYMGMIPELPISMLACARIGAPHSVVFGGFSSESLAGRINDAESRVVVTADGAYRRGTIVPLKQNVDAALENCPEVENVVVVDRVGERSKSGFVEGRDHRWHDLMEKADNYCPPEPMDSEDILYILYTSGTTGKPKGIVHTTAGYLVGVSTTHKWVFDVKDEDVYWCTADIGWVTGHSYIVYGPLANGTTSVMYEGAPDWPDKDRFWSNCEKYRVNIFYTAPTAIRTFMRWGAEHVKKHDLSSLRLLGTVGEPINPEAWMWYHKVVGGERCPIVDTWWQTETGMIMITPLPGITTTKPGSATVPFPGVEAEIVDEKGQPVPPGRGGFLVLKEPWPAMLRGIWRDPERYVKTYWSRYGNLYFTGDGSKLDEDGYFWLLGRVDDIMLIAGHNISTMEVESALVDHPDVAEAAVIGRSDPITGQAITAFVTLKLGRATGSDKAEELKAHVSKKIGSLARPKEILFTADLPKTRSGKIMRRLLRDVAEGRALGDTTTLADPSVIASLKQKYEEQEQ